MLLIEAEKANTWRKEMLSAYVKEEICNEAEN